MPVDQVYSSWLNRLRQLWPRECITRVRHMAWLMAGLWVACPCTCPGMSRWPER